MDYTDPKMRWELIKNITGFTGAINWDTSKPDGTPRKLLDVTRINEAGWKASISLQEGIEQVYKEKFVNGKEY
jgi:GDP-L-fucose synthase